MLDKTDQSADVSDNWNFLMFIVCDAIRRNTNISSKFRFMFFLFILRYCCADFSEILRKTIWRIWKTIWRMFQNETIFRLFFFLI